jgi:NAD+ synthase
MKSEVYEVGKYLGVNQEIIDAAPTDGLWGDDRTDEDQIGASYDELEWAMEMNENGKEISEFSGRQREVFSIFMRLNKANQHKMQPIPVCEIPLALKG